MVNKKEEETNNLVDGVCIAIFIVVAVTMVVGLVYFTSIGADRMKYRHCMSEYHVIYPNDAKGVLSTCMDQVYG